jgi:hypothetical protein
MTLTISLERHDVALSAAQEQRVRHHLAALGRRLEGRPEPIAILSFSGPSRQQQIQASLRVQLGPLGPTLISSQAAPTPDRAAHLAIQAVERQLERLVSGQRGEPSYGVPSRRSGGSTDRNSENQHDVQTETDDL